MNNPPLRLQAPAKGATASASLYSLIETAKVNNIEPYRCLNEVFTKLPQAKTVGDVEALLPWNVDGTAVMWKKTAAYR